MAFTIQNVCDLARTRLNDDDKSRYPDTLLEKLANEALEAMSLIAPHLFTLIGNITPTYAQSHQDLFTGNDKALALYGILAVTGGNSVLECDYYQQVAFKRSALTQTAGVPENWARHPADKDKQCATRYFLFPPPASGTLLAEYSATPTYVVLGSNAPVAEAYRPAMADFIVHRVLSIDDEAVAIQKASAHLAAFMTLMGAGVQTKQFAHEGTA